MAFTRRSTRRTTFRKRTGNRRFKRYQKKQMLKPTINRKLRQPIHYFTRFQDMGTITGLNATANTYGVTYFDLVTVPGYSEFTAMYDFFKINAVVVRYIPASNVTFTTSTAAAEQTAHYSRFISVLDYNDRTVPTSVDNLRQYANCKVTPNNVTHRRYLHPKPIFVVDEDASSGSSVGIGQLRSPWISTASNNTEFYGIKWAIEHSTLSQDIPLYKIEVKLYMSFKGRN